MTATTSASQDRHSKRGDTRQTTVAFGVLFVAFVFLAVGVIANGPLTFAIATVPFAFFFLYRLLERQNDYLTEKGVLLALVLLVTILAVILPLWLLVNYHWAGQDAQRDTKSGEFSLEGAAFTATLDHPKTSPQGEAGRSLTLTVRPAAPQAVTAYIVAPASLRVVDADGAMLDEISLEPDGEDSLRRNVRLVNIGTAEGAREIQSLCVTFDPLNDPCNGTVGQPLTAAIAVEGDHGFALRRFVESTINQASPLIFVAALFLPAAAVLAQRMVDERKKERRLEFDRRWDEFKRAFEATLDFSELLDYPESKYRDLAESYQDVSYGREELGLGEACLEYAQCYGLTTGAPPTGKPASASLLLASHGLWPIGFVTAGVHAYKRLKTSGLAIPDWLQEHNFYVINRLATIYESKEPDRDQLRARMRQIIYDEAYNPLAFFQYRKWPVKPGIEVREAQDPFAYSDAEQPEEREFLKEHFWVSHPLFKDDLFPPAGRSAQSHLVLGSKGCGRSAFAFAMLQQSSMYELTVLVEGRQGLTGLASGPIAQLINFILVHPTYLARLGPGRFRDLAALMNRSGGHRKAVQSVRETGEKLEQLHDLRQEKAREFTKGLLDTLRNALDEAAERERSGRPSGVATHGEADMTASASIHDDLLDLMKVFGFYQIVYLVDLPPKGKLAQQLKNAVIDNLEQWHDRQARFLIFAPDAVSDLFETIPSRLERHELKWSRGQIQSMARNRIGGYMPESHFDDGHDGLDRLTELCKRSPDEDDHSPRKFICLWREAARGQRAGERITNDDIDRAEAQCRTIV